MVTMIMHLDTQRIDIESRGAADTLHPLTATSAVLVQLSLKHLRLRDESTSVDPDSDDQCSIRSSCALG